MPYQPHPVFALPDDLGTIIWRYTSLAKFLAMLEDGALWFAQLRSLPDPSEGVPADAVLEEERALGEMVQAMWIEQGVDAETARKFPPPFRHELTKQYAYVNCWHRNDYESMAMWKNYGKEGVAIRSTVGRLKDSIEGVTEPVFFKPVIYRDRRNPATAEPTNNTLHPTVRKDMGYEYEREFRAVTTSAPTSVNPTKSPLGINMTFPPGINVFPVDLEILIEGVVVAPRSPTWFRKFLKKIMVRYGLDREPLASDLGEFP